MTTVSAPGPQAIPQPAPEKSMGIALMLELIGGIFQIFGIGSFYAGAPLYGFALLVMYWMLLVLMLVFAVVTVGLGLVVIPVVWVIYAIFASLVAYTNVKAANKKTIVYMVQS